MRAKNHKNRRPKQLQLAEQNAYAEKLSAIEEIFA
jgi:hypothetical protein